MAHDKRHVARALAMQELFARHVAGRSGLEVDQFLIELEETDFDDELRKVIIEGVTENKEKIDPVINKYAPAWPIEQISPVDLIVLRMGIWEGFLAKRTPEKVVINEMIELAKQFGGETSSSFVNGVLGSVLEGLQKGDIIFE